VGLLKKRRPLDSLHIAQSALDEAALVQDNVAGPDMLGFEAIEHAEAARERQRYLSRSGGLRGFGSMRRAGLSVPSSNRQTLDTGSLFPIPRPEKDPSND
jgi:hypothetical protein